MLNYLFKAQHAIIRERLSLLSLLNFSRPFLWPLVDTQWSSSLFLIHLTFYTHKSCALDPPSPPSPKVLLIPSNFVSPSDGTPSMAALPILPLLSLSLSVSPSLPLPRLIWFSLSLNLRRGSSVSHVAHCVGLMCRSSPLRLGPYQQRQTTVPLMKAALLSMLIQQQLQPIGIRLMPANSMRYSDLERNRRVRL